MAGAVSVELIDRIRGPLLAAVLDAEFVSLPRPSPERRTLERHHDPRLMDLDDATLVRTGWRLVRGALATFQTSSALAELAGCADRLPALGLILGGDVTVLAARMAIASTHMPDVQTDETAVVTAALTAMVEARAAKGSGGAAVTTLDELTDEPAVDAARTRSTPSAACACRPAATRSCSDPSPLPSFTRTSCCPRARRAPSTRPARRFSARSAAAWPGRA